MIGSLVSPGKVLLPTLKKKFWQTGDTFKLIRNSTKTKVSGEKHSTTTEIFIMTNYYIVLYYFLKERKLNEFKQRRTTTEVCSIFYV